MIIDKGMRGLKRIWSLVALGLASCASNYQIDASFPAPLVNPLPVDAGLILGEAFEAYAFEELSEDRDEIHIELGTAQAELFRVVMGQMFRSLTLESPYQGAQLLVEPSIDDFQYAIPRETRANIYEVWLKYRVQVREPNGAVLADWLINGYGKTPTALLKSQGDAIQAAVTLALRDVGVQFAIGFARQPAMVDWLQRTNGEASE